MGGLSNGLAQLFKQGRKRIGNAIDNFWVDAEARKAISDEVRNKFKPFIENAHAGESKRATNIKDLGDKVTESKANWQKAQDKWKQDYDAALADAKNQRQTEIDNYNTQLQVYQDAVDNANASKQGILDQLYDSEINFIPSKTLYTDVNTGDSYIFDRLTNKYINLTNFYKSKSSTSKDIKNLRKYIQGFDERLFDAKSKKVINAFDPSNQGYRGKNNVFDNYYLTKISTQNTALRDADRQISKANAQLNAWKGKSAPSALDEQTFKTDYEKTNGSLPSEYSFNGQTYSKESDLIDAYNKALKHEKALQASSHKNALNYTSQQNAEIAKRIQDAKDIKKAKLALGAVTGAGALAAGAAAMYGGDDTDNTDNIDNTDNTDNTYNGESDPDFNVEKEGKAILNDKQRLDTDFNPDKADALASAAYNQGVEDGSSARSSGDLVNSIAAATGGHTMDDRLFELIKAMKDPYKADAIANYIYSRHGDDPEVQRLGWRGWLNKYYGDSLRSKMNIDPSSYKGMHISGGL